VGVRGVKCKRRECLVASGNTSLSTCPDKESNAKTRNMTVLPIGVLNYLNLCNLTSFLWICFLN